MFYKCGNTAHTNSNRCRLWSGVLKQKVLNALSYWKLHTRCFCSCLELSPPSRNAEYLQEKIFVSLLNCAGFAKRWEFAIKEILHWEAVICYIPRVPETGSLKRCICMQSQVSESLPSHRCSVLVCTVDVLMLTCCFTSIPYIIIHDISVVQFLHLGLVLQGVLRTGFLDLKFYFSVQGRRIVFICLSKVESLQIRHGSQEEKILSSVANGFKLVKMSSLLHQFSKTRTQCSLKNLLRKLC